MVVLHSFIAFERMFLDVQKPAPRQKVEKPVPSDVEEEISDEEKARRAKNKELKKLGPKKDDDVEPKDMAYDIETEV